MKQQQITSERWRRVKETFQAAIELPAGEQAAYLTDACAGDPSLLTEVESLIAAHQQPGSFLDTPAVDLADGYTTRRFNTLAGQSLGHYQILSLLGRGGMGEVWRASDSRLSREVAIKVLPANFANDADLLKRFEQEARAAGMLNHPNILTIYDIGTHAGAPYIVSELLEGEELRAELRGGSVPSRKAVEYAMQTARGLAAAHEKGIVHRDLKPENLFITRDGRVKILDFGLAKLKEKRGEEERERRREGEREGEKDQTLSVSPSLPLSLSPSPTPPLTSPGVVLGTVGYMSPEQVRGLEADARADIFALGAVLYEMLTGRRAFQRESAVETMNAILREEPPELETASGKIAPQLDLIVRRCLAKRPEQRFQSASDLGFALEALRSTPASAPTLGGARNAGSRRAGPERLLWMAALALVALLPFAIAYFRRAPEAVQTTRSSIVLPEKLAIGSIALSPDGRHLAFTATDADRKTLLWVRPLDALAAKPLPGTEGAYYPFWSPDGYFIGFFAEGKLKKIALAGGPAEALCNAPRARGGAWNRDDTIIFTPFLGNPLYRVPAAGGEPATVTALDRGQNS
ncbi:MAG: protein kinase domain-containing protein, partial [Burkholderiales bacterium]